MATDDICQVFTEQTPCAPAQMQMCRCIASVIHPGAMIHSAGGCATLPRNIPANLAPPTEVLARYDT